MSDEDVVFNHHTLADEGVAGDLAALADAGILLDLDESPDLGLVPDLASVQIDELRQPDLGAQLDVLGDGAELVHR